MRLSPLEAQVMPKGSGRSDLRHWTANVSAAVIALVEHISDFINIVDRHAIAAIEPVDGLPVDESGNTQDDTGFEDYQDRSESDWSSDDEGWEDEVEELKENAGFR